MKIRSKLLIGFGTMLILMSALAGIGINRLYHLNGAMDEIYLNRYAKVSLAYAIRGNVSTASRGLLNIILNEPGLDKAKEMKTTNTALDAAGKDFAEIYKTSPDAAENKLMQELIESGTKYLEYKDNIYKYSANNQYEQAAAYRKNFGVAIQLDLNANLDELVKFQEEQVAASYNKSSDMNQVAIQFLKILLGCGLLLGLGIMIWIISSISNGLNRVLRVLANFSRGEFDVASRIQIISRDEIGEVSTAFNSMADEIEKKRQLELEYNRNKDEQTWLKTNVAHMTTLFQSAKDQKAVSQIFMSEIADMVGMTCGAFYLNEVIGYEMVLNLRGVYAYKQMEALPLTIQYGEGLVGQCALDAKILVLKEIPENYIQVKSSLGSLKPSSLLIYPVLFEGKLIAVIEMATLYEFTPLQMTLLDQLSNALSISLISIQGRTRVEELLRISQELTEELQAQSEELLLQQNELRDSNKLLEAQIEQTEQINKQIEKTKSILEQQTIQLSTSSNYKSEFLANMSHELRTPLNSMLILSQLLAENKEGNMTPKQIEFASTVHSSGSDLMRLIDEILDLSKVEAGKIEIAPELMQLSVLQEDMLRRFSLVAKKKNIAYNVYLDKVVPQALFTDSYRVEQILNNLLSNAFKFTEKGQVGLHISQADPYITFAVTDTGIGIPEEKRQMIFEAFKQENGTTSRKYGGTGLGLSISRELARLLGGKIEISSEKGQGSIFTLFLPEQYVEGVEIVPARSPHWETAISNLSLSDIEGEIIDNHTSFQDNQFKGKKILLVDDDIRNIFALSSVLENYSMKITFAENGRQALEITQQQTDFDIILMDIMMPEMDGYETIRLLRTQPQFEEIPIIALTANAMNTDRDLCIKAGASDYISKPIQIERLLALMAEKLL
ncbi:response regulator [Paenibacillus psychroresistens]|uniref:Circadian input-output histidine kinase CikA n=1 Tax=Paenibacillus psychroresistens TaxID=1778678 RepID=A0A6B8RRY7_9BACL|nr:ATP-binding protein [Paenibacillus psychroresistens]QGQ98637.1 response regulator [Paenibacillus psychroresistens]